MQKVIDQLSETKDPKLFNKKINKLLDLFDKWENNLKEREQHLLQNSKKFKNIQIQSSIIKQLNDDKENQWLQLQKQTEKRERDVENREKQLFSEKQDLDNKLKNIKDRERILTQEKEQVVFKENTYAQKNIQSDVQMNLKVQAISSRLIDKKSILTEKQNNQERRQQNCTKQQQTLNELKEKVLKQWDNIITSAQGIKQIELENKQMQLNLQEINSEIELQNNVLEKKYESLYQLQCYQNYKQTIDERENKLRLKEENIRLLQRELLNLRQLKQSSLQSQSNQQQPQSRSVSTALSETQQHDQRQSHQNKNSLQISIISQQSSRTNISGSNLSGIISIGNANGRNSNRSGNSINIFSGQNINTGHSNMNGKTLSSERNKFIQKDCNLPKPQIIINSSSNSSLTQNTLNKKPATASVIKQKFQIENIQTNDSQIFSPISKHNPMLSSFSGISPLNQNREDETVIGEGQHQTIITINSGQNLCTVNDTKSELTSKAHGNFDSSDYDYSKMHDKRRLFTDQLQDTFDLQIVEEKSFNQLSSQFSDSHQNSSSHIYQKDKQNNEKRVLLRYNKGVQQGKQYFANQISEQYDMSCQDKHCDNQNYQSVVKDQQDREYLQNLLLKKQKILQKYEESNVSSDQQEDSINLTHNLQVSPSKARVSYTYSNDKEY